MNFAETFKQICQIMGFNYDNLLPSELMKINNILTSIYDNGRLDGIQYVHKVIRETEAMYKNE
jgi:hypothetical protein